MKKENIENNEKKKDDYDKNLKIKEIINEEEDDRDVDLIEDQKEIFKDKLLEFHARQC